MLSDRCLSVCPVLSCLSVTLVYCGQTVRWIKTKLGMQLGFDAGHTVLDGDQAPPQKGAQEPPIFGPCLLWPNGWMDGSRWHLVGGRPQPWSRCARWGSMQLLLSHRGTAPNFRCPSIVAKRSPISATAEHLLTNISVKNEVVTVKLTRIFTAKFGVFRMRMAVKIVVWQ